MLRLIIHILLLAIVVAFVALNVPYTTSVNLFGYMFDDISTVAVVLVAFILGIIYSFFYYVLNYFYKAGKKKDRERRKQTKAKEKELQSKSGQTGGQGALEAPTPKRDESIDAALNDAPAPERKESVKRPKKGLFGGKKKKNQPPAEDNLGDL